MYTYPLYAMVARPKTLLGACETAPSYVSDEEAIALNEMATLRQEIRSTRRSADRMSGLLSSSGFVQQLLTQVARLKEHHHRLHEKFMLANHHKHEALGHIKPLP
ncbi:MAG: hypothetical protein G8345_15420 [Magnetococcales bacterium]|nr:hypothetical protein [Magnetococcales bacterium]NGZ28267.1 hypothetical protein [Magnetococcales bacterium]